MSHICVYCHSPRKKMTKEHLIPKSCCGVFKIKNVCGKCNGRRSSSYNYPPFLNYIYNNPDQWELAKKQAREKAANPKKPSDVKRAKKLEPFIRQTEKYLMRMEQGEVKMDDQEERIMERFDCLERRLSQENDYEERIMERFDCLENRLSQTMRSLFELLDRMESRLIYIEGRLV